jgi:hypothetical protein
MPLNEEEVGPLAASLSFNGINALALNWFLVPLAPLTLPVVLQPWNNFEGGSYLLVAELEATVNRIRLLVVFDAGSWKMKAGETLSRPYKSESDAISAAMKHAQKLGRDGHESEVVMKVMTCRFGPKGIVGIFPTRSRTVG